jgi:hypothetical protein
MDGATPASNPRAARRRRRRTLSGLGAALVLHALMLPALLFGPTRPPPPPEPPPIEVALVEPAPPAPTVAPPAPQTGGGADAPKTPAPRRRLAAAPPQRVIRDPEPSEVAPRLVPPLTEPAVSDAELASAATAGSEAAGDGGDGGEGGGSGAGGGGRCDMVGRLQRALRDDLRVRTAVAQASRAPGFAGRPLVVWNGDWVRHGLEEGKGLASVRQAIAVEVAFAPKPCRSQSMHGLVLLSLSDTPGAARIVLGSGAWRWSDLLLTP